MAATNDGSIDDTINGASFSVQSRAADIVIMTLKREVYYYIPREERYAPKTQEGRDKLLRSFKLSIEGDSSPSLTHDGYGVVKLIDDLHLSYETGFVKPEKQAFENIISFYGSKPRELVFIDDIASNIDAAAALGINAVLYKSPEDLSCALTELRLRL